MKSVFFVTGTDTDVGKTRVTQSILRLAKQEGRRTLGLKPLAAGAQLVDEQWQNQDAQLLMQEHSAALPYEQINPICLQQPLAPHIAAANEGKRLSVSSLAGFCRGAMLASDAQLTLIEGAGGWLVPLNDKETLADLAVVLQTPVILVVAMRLGCLNHALLTMQAIQWSGLPLAGWVANCVQPNMPYLDENIYALRTRLPAPFIGSMPFDENPEQISTDWLIREQNPFRFGMTEMI